MNPMTTPYENGVADIMSFVIAWSIAALLVVVLPMWVVSTFLAVTSLRRHPGLIATSRRSASVWSIAVWLPLIGPAAHGIALFSRCMQLGPVDWRAARSRVKPHPVLAGAPVHRSGPPLPYPIRPPYPYPIGGYPVSGCPTGVWNDPPRPAPCGPAYRAMPEHRPLQPPQPSGAPQRHPARPKR